MTNYNKQYFTCIYPKFHEDETLISENSYFSSKS